MPAARTCGWSEESCSQRTTRSTNPSNICRNEAGISQRREATQQTTKTYARRYCAAPFEENCTLRNFDFGSAKKICG
jgi:hypothetical protein